MPGVESKFNPQHFDKMYGNDFVYLQFDPNTERRHRRFRAFFAAQDPAMDPPTRTDIPNCDVLPLVKLLNCVAKEAWQLGLSF